MGSACCLTIAKKKSTKENQIINQENDPEIKSINDQNDKMNNLLSNFGDEDKKENYPNFIQSATLNNNDFKFTMTNNEFINCYIKLDKNILEQMASLKDSKVLLNCAYDSSKNLLPKRKQRSLIVSNPNLIIVVDQSMNNDSQEIVF